MRSALRIQATKITRSRTIPTILSIAYPFAPVRPEGAGGAEQVLRTLESALPAHGFRSLVAAQEGSEVGGELFATSVPPGTLTPELRAEVEAAHQATIDRALASAPIDLIHCHGIDFHRYRLRPDLPILVTLHLPPAWYPDTIWSLPPNVHLQCVSRTQLQACPASARPSLLVVENGVPIPPELPTRKGRYALILSRICPEKNIHTALDAARLARIPVLLAGEVFPYPEHLAYFEHEIKPRLHRQARFLGPVGGQAKQRLLARARCLLLPTLAPETSSLVAMEALAAGTPVIAFPSGAIPEIVTDALTGFLVQDTASMAAALHRLPELDPATCRSEALHRFSARRMIQQYLALYSRLTP